ncbi:hypothetical protein D1007_08410 [Hordeum vulgare]|nr:hypothetical protein D1007_08410 [Hordeum vulgare]
MRRLLRLLCCWEFVRGRLVLADHHSIEEKGGPEDDVGQLRGGVIGPEDYLPLGQEDHLMRAIMERSVREAAEEAACNRRELEIE